MHITTFHFELKRSLVEDGQSWSHFLPFVSTMHSLKQNGGVVIYEALGV